MPTARWDEAISDDEGIYDDLSPLIDLDGTIWDLGDEDAPVMETHVKPVTW